ncbi:ATP-binding protein [Roseateles asaccharophilus]|uniref:histidine kinase n=1 Tax=Roseateles asaccharophilus TaxID=582607 RepID=A0ABU2ACS9_9BURK|nr:ATP-binding protein [Roseateles asaccharophilus]MDR7335009.1 signal transduction histidine kinase [Roseateles asaccharophilus]
MKSLSDDSAASRRLERRMPMRLLVLGLAAAALLMLLLGVLVVLALVRVWGGDVGLVHAALVLTAFFTGLMVLVAAALGWHAGVRLTRQRLAEPLREVRQQLHLQHQLQRDWQWATDAQHRLVRWQAPQGAPSSSWVGACGSTQLLWEKFPAAEQASELRERVQAHQPFTELLIVDGGTRWRLRGLPCMDGQGHFAGFAGTARPEETAVAVPPATSDLAAEHESFSYTVSHDLRAPLRVVEGFARILKEDYGARLDRVGNDHLDRVMSAAARMNSMIDALLSLSQLSTRPLARQPVNLSQQAGYVMEELKRAAPQRELELDIEPDLTVQGDPTLLRMVLENLLGNAWKYSAKLPCTQIRFGSVEQGGRQVYVVSDNGAGFDMRFAERLFGVFQRLHSASDFQGTGVGLALVRRIVRRHGGDIWAESAVGEGARFYFTLG